MQVIDKSSGAYRVVQTIGSSTDPKQIDALYSKGLNWIASYAGQKQFDFTDERHLFEQFLSGIRQVSVSGIELLLGKLFDQVGFGQIPDVLFRQLVLARICNPVSKLKTVDYLRKYHSQHFDEDAIYRYLDKLYNTQKEAVQQISYEHTLKILDGKMNIVFYDVTTLYFEADQEDEFEEQVSVRKESTKTHKLSWASWSVSTGIRLPTKYLKGINLKGIPCSRSLMLLRHVTDSTNWSS